MIEGTTSTSGRTYRSNYAEYATTEPWIDNNLWPGNGNKALTVIYSQKGFLKAKDDWVAMRYNALRH
ncbi:hypothetical protein CEXT_533811 [Caerostris extrusa]|uniref:Uncharacterized protein n=1 Tax=Caerostris extrusa TaxID=172846 RepID=A0AAV4P9U4_CAEEX|nr:hypothetical protein CEXT_533811 [Caerostris extrusa]